MQGHDDDGEGERSPSPVGRAVEMLSKAGGALASALLIVMLGLIIYAVAQRYVLGVPLTWADDLSSYLLVAFVAFGVSEALRRGDHIAIDLLVNRQSPAMRRVLAFWSDFAVLVFAAVLAWSAWGQATFAYDFGSFTNDRLEMPAWIPLVPLVVGAGLLTLLALVRILFGSGRRETGT